MWSEKLSKFIRFEVRDDTRIWRKLCCGDALLKDAFPEILRSACDTDVTVTEIQSSINSIFFPFIIVVSQESMNNHFGLVLQCKEMRTDEFCWFGITLVMPRMIIVLLKGDLVDSKHKFK